MGLKSSIRISSNIKISQRSMSPESQKLMEIFQLAGQKKDILRFLTQKEQFNELVAGDVIQSLALGMLEDLHLDVSALADVLPEYLRDDFKDFFNSMYLVSNRLALSRLHFAQDVLSVHFKNQEDWGDLSQLSSLELAPAIEYVLEKEKECFEQDTAAFSKYLDDIIVGSEEIIRELEAAPENIKFKTILELSERINQDYYLSDEERKELNDIQASFIYNFTFHTREILGKSPSAILHDWLSLHTKYHFELKRQLPPEARENLENTIMYFLNPSYRKRLTKKHRDNVYLKPIGSFIQDLKRYRDIAIRAKKDLEELRGLKNHPSFYYQDPKVVMGEFFKFTELTYINTRTILATQLMREHISPEMENIKKTVLDKGFRDRYYKNIQRTIYHEFGHYVLENLASRSNPGPIFFIDPFLQTFKKLERDIKSEELSPTELLSMVPSEYSLTNFNEFFCEYLGFWYSSQGNKDLLDRYKEKWPSGIVRNLERNSG